MSVEDYREKFKDSAAQKKYTTVSIPITLYERIRNIIEGTGFKSVSDYVTFVLREIISMQEKEKLSQPFTKEDIERIKEKLKALGYL
ncbi:MAG: CopG family transcriptional regulator [Candidatus Caldarchaeales archaeon]